MTPNPFFKDTPLFDFEYLRNGLNRQNYNGVPCQLSKRVSFPAALFFSAAFCKSHEAIWYERHSSFVSPPICIILQNFTSIGVTVAEISVSKQKKYKCVSKTHTRGAVKAMCNIQGNISVANCMPLHSLLKTVKINGRVQFRWYTKIAILDEYLIINCWK